SATKRIQTEARGSLVYFLFSADPEEGAIEHPRDGHGNDHRESKQNDRGTKGHRPQSQTGDREKGFVELHLTEALLDRLQVLLVHGLRREDRQSYLEGDYCREPKQTPQQQCHATSSICGFPRSISLVERPPLSLLMNSMALEKFMNFSSLSVTSR